MGLHVPISVGHERYLVKRASRDTALERGPTLTRCIEQTIKRRDDGSSWRWHWERWNRRSFYAGFGKLRAASRQCLHHRNDEESVLCCSWQR